MHNIQPLKNTLLFSLLLATPLSQANPVACFSSNMGPFCIELFETQTPITTANFLNYINSDAYTGGIFHRRVTGFVIQGGGYKIVEGSSGKTLASVNTFPPIKNEFKISNTRGTVAMAKVGGNPDSATSQWFVNLADNSGNLDFQNGGFTVFGRVLFDGMKVFDAIGKLPKVNLGGSLSDTPTINAAGAINSTDDFVQINQVEVTDVTGVFSEELLSFAVDIDSSQTFEVRLRLIESNPFLVFELEPTSVAPLSNKPANIATFSSASGLLQIPSVMINASTTVHNVSMQLTGTDSYQFKLISYD